MLLLLFTGYVLRKDVPAPRRLSLPSRSSWPSVLGPALNDDLLHRRSRHAASVCLHHNTGPALAGLGLGASTPLPDCFTDYLPAAGMVLLFSVFITARLDPENSASRISPAPGSFSAFRNCFATSRPLLPVFCFQRSSSWRCSLPRNVIPFSLGAHPPRRLAFLLSHPDGHGPDPLNLSAGFCRLRLAARATDKKRVAPVHGGQPFGKYLFLLSRGKRRGV